MAMVGVAGDGVPYLSAGTDAAGRLLSMAELLIHAES
jgi:hypothetical protein